MNDFIESYSEEWGDDPVSLLKDYKVQPELTAELESINGSDLDYETLYKIVLWKLNRFPRIPAELLEELKNIPAIAPMKHEKSLEIVKKLLKSPGVALPMASTLLRFLNPKAFQIIDERAYRVLYPHDKKYPGKPKAKLERYLDESTKIYFSYLDKLHSISSDKLPFEKADKILYLLDIKLGNKIGGKTKPS